MNSDKDCKESKISALRPVSHIGLYTCNYIGLYKGFHNPLVNSDKDCRIFNVCMCDLLASI